MASDPSWITVKHDDVYSFQYTTDDDAAGNDGGWATI
jgi:hypothetical protein